MASGECNMKSINTILIANRGEIASRVIKTCRSMGVRTIAIHSPADQNSPYTEEADLAVLIGDNAPNTSYLNQDLIISTAKAHQADAIHPGYGFLSENADFAKRCKNEGIIFIGPNADAITAMGSKSTAKTLMKKHKVPTIPGYEGKEQSTAHLKKVAKQVGFPLLLKATAGGGGKGMRVVEKEKDLTTAIDAAKREALSAFGNDEMIVEKYISSGRHIEFQIFGDQHGNAIHLLERECTIQRRHQKVLEESPSPVMTPKLRKAMGEAAVNAAKALNYDNAGTVEFIYDDKSGEFFFLEVNTRLQVEHPVTEEVTGLDLVKMQIESAQGMPLSIQQKDVKSNGYAIELRLYAEDPQNDFLPVTGRVAAFEYPNIDGLRIESAIRSNSDISVYYDPMIAKVIVHDENRESAMRKMGFVMDQMVCLGTTTNQNFLSQLVRHHKVIKGEYNTHFIEQHPEVLNQKEESNTFFAMAATMHLHQQRRTQQKILRNIPGGWRNNYYTAQSCKYALKEKEIEVKYRQKNNAFEFYIGEKTHTLNLLKCNECILSIQIDGVTYHFRIVENGNDLCLHNSTLGTSIITPMDRFPSKEKEQEKGSCMAPMPSQVIDVLVKVNDKVKAGDPMVILSSMKMENTICADEDGVVKEIYSKAGENIEAGFTILKISTS